MSGHPIPFAALDGNPFVQGNQYLVSRDHWIDLEVAERIAKRISVSNGCWIVAAKPNHAGYVVVSNHGHTVYAHRAIYAFVNGPIIVGQVICHTCDVKPCVRPDHLVAGVQAINVEDMWAKGRAVAPPKLLGEANGKASLSDAQITHLRSGAFQGMSQRAIAQYFGVSQSTVCRLLHGDTRSQGTGIRPNLTPTPRNFSRVTSS